MPVFETNFGSGDWLVGRVCVTVLVIQTKQIYAHSERGACEIMSLGTNIETASHVQRIGHCHLSCTESFNVSHIGPQGQICSRPFVQTMTRCPAADGTHLCSKESLRKSVKFRAPPLDHTCTNGQCRLPVLIRTRDLPYAMAQCFRFFLLFWG
jgi:hypothetical protein